MKGSKYFSLKYLLLFAIIEWYFCLKIIVETKHLRRNMDTLLTPAENVKEFDCECGKINRKVDEERLAKVKVAGGKLPWLAELTTSESGNSIEDTEIFNLCFGTLVSLQTVLFPASCIQRNVYSYTAQNKPRVKIVGIVNNTASLYEILNIRIHPNYRNNVDNDLALVKLRRKIDVNSSEKIVPICLPPPSATNNPQFKLVDNLLIPVNHVESDIYQYLYERGDVDNYDDQEIAKINQCTNPNQPCAQLKCSTPCTRAKAPKPSFVLEQSVTRTWFYRKAAGYDYIQHYGRFPVQPVNSTACHSLFPEMLQSKVQCIQQKTIREIVKQNEYFFKKLELGMPLMLSNTTLVKGKPQAATTKFYLEGIRTPGRNGLPLLEARNNTISLLKVEGYVNWIRETSGSENFCKII